MFVTNGLTVACGLHVTFSAFQRNKKPCTNVTWTIEWVMIKVRFIIVDNIKIWWTVLKVVMSARSYFTPSFITTTWAMLSVKVACGSKKTKFAVRRRIRTPSASGIHYDSWHINVQNTTFLGEKTNIERNVKLQKVIGHSALDSMWKVSSWVLTVPPPESWICNSTDHNHWETHFV